MSCVADIRRLKVLRKHPLADAGTTRKAKWTPQSNSVSALDLETSAALFSYTLLPRHFCLRVNFETFHLLSLGFMVISHKKLCSPK